MTKYVQKSWALTFWLADDSATSLLRAQSGGWLGVHGQTTGHKPVPIGGHIIAGPVATAISNGTARAGGH